MLTPLTHNVLMGMTDAITRVTADGFSAVLKVLWAGSGEEHASWRTSDRPDAWNYWRREALVYEHDLPALYAAAGLGAPRLLALHHRADGRIALWLEDVEGTPGAKWRLEHFAELAMRLGRTQGSIAVSRLTPALPWLSRRFLREYSTSRGVDRSVLGSDDAWDQPVVRDHLPASLRTEGARLIAERDRFFELMERLPRTLCHLDVWPNNLLMRTDGTPVLLDWAFVGDGALGEDIGNLVPDSVFDLFLPAKLLPELDAAVFGSYVAGLRDAGWEGDERVVRLGMCASAVKYEWLLPWILQRAGDAVQLDYGRQGTVDAALRYAERGATLAYLMGWLDEARRLQHDLRL